MLTINVEFVLVLVLEFAYELVLLILEVLNICLKDKDSIVIFFLVLLFLDNSSNNLD